MLAVRNMTRRKTRSALTILGVAIGIAAVVALIAVARGIRRQFNVVFAAGEAHLVLSRAGAAAPTPIIVIRLSLNLLASLCDSSS